MPRFSGEGDGPLDPERSGDRLFIDGYGNGGFRIGGEPYRGSVIVLPSTVLAWTVLDAATASPDTLDEFLQQAGATELLLYGGGSRMQPVPADIREACRSADIAVEPMDTGAAARTYNVLLAEDRRVSAALIAI